MSFAFRCSQLILLGQKKKKNKAASDYSVNEKMMF